MAAEQDAKTDEGGGEDFEEKTFVYAGPIFPPGYAAGPSDSPRILAQGGPDVQKTVSLTGQEKFEYMLLYCLKLLQQGGDGICAFYVDDFDDCDEFTMRVIQRLIGRSGYVTSDFCPKPRGRYAGFWAWRKTN